MIPVLPGHGDPRYTLGIVIPVPEPVRGVLRGWRERFGAADAQAVDPHVTLVTGAHREDWSGAAAHVRRVAAAHRAFEVVLGPARSFRPLSPVVYLPLLAGSGQCRALHEALLDGPLIHDSPFDYHPHLTIAQNVEEQALDVAQQRLSQTSLAFRAEQLLLFEMTDGRWQLRERMPLGR